MFCEAQQEIINAYCYVLLQQNNNERDSLEYRGMDRKKYNNTDKVRIT